MSDIDNDIHCGLADMRLHMPDILDELYHNNWFTGGQYNAAVQLIENNSMTMLSGYVNYLYDSNVSKLVERVLRRVIYSESRIHAPPFSDVNTTAYVNAHIHHMYQTKMLNQLEYQYLIAQLDRSNVVLEAALACVMDDSTNNKTIAAAELHDTFKRLSQQYQRHVQYIDSVYNELHLPATAYIQWLYRRCLDHKTCATISNMSVTLSSADCMYLLDLLQYSMSSNTATDVLYAAMDTYIVSEQLLDAQDDNVYQHALAVLQDELDDTLCKLGQRWRLDCTAQQQGVLEQLEIMCNKQRLLRAECELLEELVYREDSETIDIVVHSQSIVTDEISNVIDLTLQPEYAIALINVQTVLRHANKLFSFNSGGSRVLQPLTRAGEAYIQSLIDSHDATVLAIGALHVATNAGFVETYDNISRLSCRWRIRAESNEQQLLVLLNHLIDAQHIPSSMGETLELCVYRRDSALCQAFKDFRLRHSDSDKNNRLLDQNWERMWTAIVNVLATHYEGVEAL